MAQTETIEETLVHEDTHCLAHYQDFTKPWCTALCGKKLLGEFAGYNAEICFVCKDLLGRNRQ